MSDDLRSALLISAIGLGLVFGVILLLWGLMALIVRITAGPAGEEPKAQGGGAGAGTGDSADREQPADTARARAAAAAVAAYLASERRAP